MEWKRKQKIQKFIKAAGIDSVNFPWNFPTWHAISENYLIIQQI